MARLPLHPANPERVCWGCEKLCPAHEMFCGNEIVRAAHPIELFGPDWHEWAGGAQVPPGAEPAGASAPGVCQVKELR